MDAINASWKNLVDNGRRVEVKGPLRTALIDATVWSARPDVEAPPRFPDGYGPSPDHELMPRRIVRTVLWKEGANYVRQDFVEMLYELKPELVR